MSFIVGIVAKLLEWLFEKLGSFVLSQVRKKEQDDEAEKKAQEDSDRLKKAQTPEEKQDAAKHIIDDTFR